MVPAENGVDQHAAGRLGLIVGQALGLNGVDPEAECDEHEDAHAEEETAFPLEAGLAEQALEGAIGHGSPGLGLAARAHVRGTAGENETGDGRLAADARFAGAAVDAELALIVALDAGTADVVADARAAFVDR